MTFERTFLGRKGEDAAASYLLAKGYRIVERNWRSKLGELDIITKKGRTIIFVEVKTRLSGNEWYHAEDNITKAKQKKLQRLAEFYLLTKNIPDNQEWQIDVIAVEIDEAGGAYQIRHTEQAIHAE